MWAIVAAIIFGIAALGPNSLGPVELIYVGLFFLALHLLWSWNPFTTFNRQP